MSDLGSRRGTDPEVYEPAEDSALLAGEVAESVAETDLVLDVGTGTGYVAHRVSEAGATAVGVDLNPHACRQARDNGVSVVRGSLTAAFAGRVFDVVAFNPPYLPTDSEVTFEGWFETAVAGGPSGRAVIEEFLDDVGRVLAATGEVYLLVSTFTDPESVVEYAGERGFSAAAVAEATFPGETLTVLRLWR